MKVIIRILQVIILTIFLQVGNVIAKYTHIPLPGSIFGLLILFILLQLRVLKIEWIEQGASWLLSELLLFFIPAAVGVVNYQQVIGSKWGKLIVVIALSTLTVMACTGLTAQWIAKRGKGVFHEPPAKNR